MFLFGVMLVLTVFVGITPWRYPKESASSNVATSRLKQSSEKTPKAELLKIWVVIAAAVLVVIMGIMAISASWAVTSQITFALWTTAVLIGILLSSVTMLISMQNTSRLIRYSQSSTEGKIVAVHGCIDEDLKSMSRTFLEIIAKNGEETRKTLSSSLLEVHKSLKEELRK